jgi:hypothetical protein
MSHRVWPASVHIRSGSSVLVPVRIDGLPERIEALGESWERARDLQVTVIPAELIRSAGSAQADPWEIVAAVLDRHDVGPISIRRDVRRVADPDRPGLRTVIAMAEVEGLADVYAALSAALGAPLRVPPVHVTLYSSDPTATIDLSDREQLRERAPALPLEQQAELQLAMRFGEALFDDGGIPADSPEDGLIALGATDRVFTPEVMRALAYAAHVHRYQRRKATGIPYLAHLISVAALVAEDGGEEREVIVALLHDVAEDHGGEARLTDVSGRFGLEVASMVRALSDSLGPEGVLKESWRPRKQRYLDHLRTERRAGVLRVSNADKLHNARAILADYRHVGEAIWRRFEGSPTEQLWYYSELSATFNERRPSSPLARELAETIRQLEAEMQATAAP